MYLINRIYTLTKKIPSGRYASEPFIKIKSLPSCMSGIRTTILLLCTLTNVVIACKVIYPAVSFLHLSLCYTIRFNAT